MNINTLSNQIMRPSFRFIGIAIAAATALHAAPFLAIGDNAEVFLTGTLGSKYDDNLYLTKNNTKSSFIFDEIPGVELDFGHNSLYKGVFSFKEDLIQYASASKQNTGLANAQFSSAYNDEKLIFKLAGGFQQIAQNSRDAVNVAGVIVRHDSASAGTSGEVVISQKTTVKLGFDYDKSKYKTPGYIDQANYNFPVSAYYEVAPKLAAALGYRFRDTEIKGANSKEHNFSIGARGDFTPKLQGSFNVGYTERKPNSGSSSSLVGLDANLTYLFSPKTTFRLTGTNDFANAATGDAQKVFGVIGGVTSVLNEEFTADASVGYHSYDYIGSGRKDDYYEGQVGLTYKYNTYLNFTGAYSYRNNSSTSPAQFSDNLLSIAANVRY